VEIRQLSGVIVGHKHGNAVTHGHGLERVALEHDVGCGQQHAPVPACVRRQIRCHGRRETGKAKQVEVAYVGVGGHDKNPIVRTQRGKHLLRRVVRQDQNIRRRARSAQRINQQLERARPQLERARGVRT